MRAELERAAASFRDGYNCAQSVLGAHRGALGLDRDTALRMACGFGAGMGRSQGVCGAVSGAILVLGLRHGRRSEDERQVTEATYAQVRTLMERFRRHHGTYVCRELLRGCDLTTAEGQRFYRDNDLENQVCIPCIQTAITILAELESAPAPAQ